MVIAHVICIVNMCSVILSDRFLYLGLNLGWQHILCSCSNSNCAQSNQLSVCDQTVRSGSSEFQATSMDDLLAHLKAINDPACKFLHMPYMDYMVQQYTYGSNTKDKGLHLMPNDFATNVLERYCNALINLFNGRAFAKKDLEAVSCRERLQAHYTGLASPG